MGYLHIDNLYKNQDILLFKECYALEKIHGSSANVSWNGSLDFFAGGVKHETFVKLFDSEKLTAGFTALGHPKLTVYGEVYGGSMQGCSEIYGKSLKFIAFDVQVGGVWLAVPDMADVVEALGLEVVAWEKTSTELRCLDIERDRPSVQAERNGCGVHPREGVVLRPLIELVKNNGHRVIAKHRIEKYNERSTPQKIISPEMLVVLTKADEIAKEWVTPMRLAHVLQKFPAPLEISLVPKVIDAMVEDVYREAKNEIAESKEAKRAISKRTAEMFKARVTKVVEG